MYMLLSPASECSSQIECIKTINAAIISFKYIRAIRWQIRLRADAINGLFIEILRRRRAGHRSVWFCASCWATPRSYGAEECETFMHACPTGHDDKAYNVFLATVHCHCPSSRLATGVRPGRQQGRRQTRVLDAGHDILRTATCIILPPI